MLKRLNKITDATSLSKSDQKSLNGGLTLKKNDCATVCATAPSGTDCLVNGNPHCPAICDGHGGWVNLQWKTKEDTDSKADPTNR